MGKERFDKIEKMAEIVKGYCDVCPVKDKEQETCLLCKMEHLHNHNYRQVNEDLAIQCTCYALGCQEGEKIKQTTVQEISNLVYDLIRVIESESGMDIVQKSYYKASLDLLLTKINERYGV